MICKEAFSRINGIRRFEVHPSLLFIILKGELSGPAQLVPASYAFSIIARPRFLARLRRWPQRLQKLGPLTLSNNWNPTGQSVSSFRFKVQVDDFAARPGL